MDDISRIDFETHPDSYRHWRLRVDGPVATLAMQVEEHGGLRSDYALKLNSYDLSVDIELADAVNRLRFEYPEVSVVVLTSAQPGVFSAGANIFMLGSSTHGFKVNFCRFTNETRLAIEEATAESGQTYVAALNGIASGGGYELALACEKIFLIDDRRSAVALPEVPYLGVLPGTGGLTRLVDKRGIRRDRADVFCSLAEGLKGRKAKAWGLVDDVFPSSRFEAAVQEAAQALVSGDKPSRPGIALEPLAPEVDENTVRYRYVTLTLDPSQRHAGLTIRAPHEVPALPTDGTPMPSTWYPLQMFRELDDALLRLRFNAPQVGLVKLQTRGDAANLRALDAQLAGAWESDPLVREVVLLGRRVLKRLDMTAKSVFALVDEESCFVGTLLELAMAADRTYMLDTPGVEVATTAMNFGLYPMGNGLTRLQVRHLSNLEVVETLRDQAFAGDEADAAGLVTVVADDIDWDDEVRLALEERSSLSPDALTGMEANLRFAGPETLETKIFGRLSAWQNWIFQRPNAVGERGALTLYGQPQRPEFSWERT